MLLKIASLVAGLMENQIRMIQILSKLLEVYWFNQLYLNYV